MNARHRLIIDCDPGIDDAVALLLAAASAEFELLAVTCVAGNRPLATVTDNACRVLDLAGRRDVAVHAGCSRPLAHAQPRCATVHGEDGLGGLALPRGRAPSGLHAMDFIERTLLAPDAGEVTLVAVGPLTNLALAEIKRPGLLRRARTLLVMGGAAFCDGNVTPSAEFNFHADALAAHTVLGCGAPVRLFGLDVTRQAAMPREWVEALSAIGNRCADAVRTMLSFGQRPQLLHDACPVAWLLRPELFDGQPCTVAVDWRPGMTEGHLAARRLRERNGDAARDDRPQGNPHQGDPSQGDPSQGHPRQGDPSQGDPSQGDPRQDHPRQDGRHQDDPPQGNLAEVYTGVQAEGLRSLLRQRLASLP